MWEFLSEHYKWIGPLAGSLVTYLGTLGHRRWTQHKKEVEVREELRKTLDNLYKALDEAYDKQLQHKQELLNLKDQIQQKDAHIGRLQREAEEMRTILTSFENENQKLTRDIEQLRDQIQALEAKIK